MVLFRYKLTKNVSDKKNTKIKSLYIRKIYGRKKYLTIKICILTIFNIYLYPETMEVPKKDLELTERKYKYLVSILEDTRCKYKNKIDLVDKIISIYAIINKDKIDRILPFERSILVYYILFGFNKESKEIVEKELKKNENQINTTNTNLRNKGYLFRDRNNRTKGYVLKDLQKLADSFIQNPDKLLAIKFDK